MKSSRNVSIILNTLIILFEIIGITIYVLNNPYFDLVYYTHDSNLLALITSTIYLFFILRKKELPKWASLLKYTSTLALTITFLIVLFVLIPMDHFNFEFYLFNKAMLYFHLICPILALISFLFFEKHKISGLKDNIRALYYTVIYTIVLIILNVIKVVDGPYPFLRVRTNPVIGSILWLIFIDAGAIGLSILISKINNKMTKSIE